MRHFFITAALLCCALTLVAQHAVQGKILDENNQVLQGASIRIEGSSEGKVSNAEGEFFIDKLNDKEYVLLVDFLGYETSSIRTKPAKNILVKMRRKSYGLDEITVKSTRANERSAIAYSNVGAEDISVRNLGQDIPYLLSLTPSFVTTSDAGTGIGYTGFRIRGTDANRINVTVNGIPYNDAESHGSFFVNIPDIASSLSSVQVQRGVGTSTNGAPAFGASINMQTENKLLSPFAELSGTYGSFNTSKYTVKVGTGLLPGKFALEGRISGINSDGFVDRAFSDLKSYYFSAGYFAENTSLKFVSFGGKEKTYQAWNGVDLEMLRLNPLEYKRTYNDIGKYVDDEGNVKFYDNQTDNYTQIHYQLHWIQKLHANLHLNAALHYTDGIGYYEDYKTGRKYYEYGLEPAIVNGTTLSKTDLIRQKWLESDFYGLIFSLNYKKDKLEASFGGGMNRYLCDHTGKVIWVRHPNNFDPRKNWYFNQSTKDDANIYLKANAELIENFFATADLQYRYIYYDMNGQDDKYDGAAGTMRDITQAHDFHFFNPKFGLMYKPNSRNDIYASFSVANREPNRNNYTDAGESDRPTSERLYDLETGYRYQSSRFSASANFYYMKYKDQLILTGKISDIGEPLTSNIPDSYRMGVELIAAYKFSDLLRWNGNMTVSRNKILNFTEEVENYAADWSDLPPWVNHFEKTDIAYSPSIIANSIFTFSYNNFQADIYSTYVGKQYIDNTGNDTRSINPYFVNNLSLSYSHPLKKYLKSIDIQVLINNIFNVEYETNGYVWWTYYLDGQRMNELRHFPQAGTNFLISTTFKF